MSCKVLHASYNSGWKTDKSSEGFLGMGFRYGKHSFRILVIKQLDAQNIAL